MAVLQSQTEVTQRAWLWLHDRVRSVGRRTHRSESEAPNSPASRRLLPSKVLVLTHLALISGYEQKEKKINEARPHADYVKVCQWPGNIAVF